MKTSAFRNWLRNKWYEHLDEIATYGLPTPPYTSEFYYRTYKWWLKREYKHEIGS
jgi:hypothetical protein